MSLYGKHVLFWTCVLTVCEWQITDDDFKEYVTCYLWLIFNAIEHPSKIIIYHKYWKAFTYSQRVTNYSVAKLSIMETRLCRSCLEIPGYIYHYVCSTENSGYIYYYVCSTEKYPLKSFKKYFEEMFSMTVSYDK